MAVLSNTSRITISGAVDSTPPYVSELTISPLDESDSGGYTCTVTVVPRAGEEDVIGSEAVYQQLTITVNGEIAYYS